MPSAVVSSIEYDAARATLRVTFVSGRVYDYLHVPQEVFIAMKISFSKGIYFNEHIKGYYQFERIH